MTPVRPHVAIAGGGTGGHLYPVLSVANEIRKRCPDARFTFITTDRPIDERVIWSVLDRGGPPIEVAAQAVDPLPGSLLAVPRFLRHWRASVRLCGNLFAQHRPDVVVGSGGFGSGPPIVAGRRARARTILLNPDAKPGKANRFLARKADAIFVQWPVTRSRFRNPTTVHVTGCPVRSAFTRTSRSQGLRRFDLEGSKRTLLVTGASQGARSINEAVMVALDGLAGIPGWQFLHLAGPGDHRLVQSAYESRRMPAKVLAYTDNMPDALAAADLVLSRAGASTLAEITAVGVASVLMPYPYHRDQHQLANATILAERGAALIVKDRVSPQVNGPILVEVLGRLMSDPHQLTGMAHAAADLGTIDAASTIADAVLELAGWKSREREPGAAGSSPPGEDCAPRSDAPGSIGSGKWSRIEPGTDMSTVGA